ncbi:unnamed protein product [Natator depressus]
MKGRLTLNIAIIIQVWNETDRLERVQRRATKMIQGLNSKEPFRKWRPLGLLERGHTTRASNTASCPPREGPELAERGLAGEPECCWVRSFRIGLVENEPFGERGRPPGGRTRSPGL